MTDTKHRDDVVAMNTTLWGGGMRGRFRLYFNRHGRAGLPACVSMRDDPEWEIAVRGWTVHVRSTTVYRPKETADDDDGVPSFWVEAEGELTIESGFAVIRAVSG